jgi:hypothetical protein
MTETERNLIQFLTRAENLPDVLEILRRGEEVRKRALL